MLHFEPVGVQVLRFGAQGDRQIFGMRLHLRFQGRHLGGLAFQAASPSALGGHSFVLRLHQHQLGFEVVKGRVLLEGRKIFERLALLHVPVQLFKLFLGLGVLNLFLSKFLV